MSQLYTMNKKLCCCVLLLILLMLENDCVSGKKRSGRKGRGKSCRSNCNKKMTFSASVIRRCISRCPGSKRRTKATKSPRKATRTPTVATTVPVTSKGCPQLTFEQLSPEQSQVLSLRCAQACSEVGDGAWMGCVEDCMKKCANEYNDCVDEKGSDRNILKTISSMGYSSSLMSLLDRSLWKPPVSSSGCSYFEEDDGNNQQGYASTKARTPKPTTETTKNPSRSGTSDCPPTMTYTSCASKCTATCDDPWPACSRGGCKRNSNCVCPPHMVQPDAKNMTCIPMLQCSDIYLSTHPPTETSAFFFFETTIPDEQQTFYGAESGVFTTPETIY